VSPVDLEIRSSGFCLKSVLIGEGYVSGRCSPLGPAPYDGVEAARPPFDFTFFSCPLSSLGCLGLWFPLVIKLSEMNRDLMDIDVVPPSDLLVTDRPHTF